MAAIRFRISELFYFTAAIAIGCGVTQLPELGWREGLYATTVFFVVSWTMRECLFLDRARKTNTGLSADQRFELRFLAWGRFATALVLAAALSLHLLAKAGLISLAEAESDWFLPAGERARAALIDLSLLICIVSPTLFFPLRARSVWTTAVDIIAIGGAAVLGAVVIGYNETIITFLVYVAVRGVEQYYSGSIEPLGEHFAYQLLACAFAAILLLIVTNFVATRWGLRRRSRIGLLCMIAVAVVALAWFTARLVMVDLRRLSPATHEAILLGPLNRWFTTGALLILASSAWTYLTVRRSMYYQLPASLALPSSRHTRVAMPALVFGVLTAIGLAVLYEHLFDQQLIQMKGGGWIAVRRNWQDIVSELAFAQNLLPIAVWLASGLLLFRAWRVRGTAPTLLVYGLPRAAFTTLLGFNLVIVALAGFLAAWATFAIWLTPWYRWFG